MPRSWLSEAARIAAGSAARRSMMPASLCKPWPGLAGLRTPGAGKVTASKRRLPGAQHLSPERAEMVLRRRLDAVDAGSHSAMLR